MGQTLVGFQRAAQPFVSWPSATSIKLRPLTTLSPKQVDRAIASAKKIFPGASVERSIGAALSPQDEWPRSFREIAQRVERHNAYLDDMRIGMTGFAVLADGERETIWLEWIGVRSKHRGHGYGPKILEASMELASQNGFGTMRLWTTTDHEQAIGMYNKAGFHCQETPYEWNDGCAVQIHSIGLNGQPIQPYRGINGDVGCALYGVQRYVQRRQPT